MNPDQIVRYSRQIALHPFGGRGQRRLLEGAVSVRGEGLAAELAALYLQAAGVGRVLVDPDLASRLEDDINPDVTVSVLSDSDVATANVDLSRADPDPVDAFEAGARAALSALCTVAGVS